MHRVNVGLLCLLSLSLAGSVFGQVADNPAAEPSGIASLQTADPSGVVSYDNYSGGATFGSGSYFNIRHMTGKGVGYNGSYSQIGGFVPIWVGENTFIAPDTRLILSNSSQVGANAGLVGRTYAPSFDRIFGVYGYFDTDQSTNNFRYNQGSAGIETLGQFLDFRLNGYFPTSTQDNFVTTGPAICVSGTPFFMGHNIVFNGQQAQTREQSLQGWDFEFGIPVSGSMPWLRAYAGMYGYNSNYVAPVASTDPIPGLTHKNPVGFRGRLDAWISDDLLAGVNVTTDPVWGTNVNAVIDFRFSGYKPTRYFPNWTTRERMLAPVQRNWRVAVAQYGTATNTPVDAINPSTGQPYFVDFINNAAPAGGDGSFEHPFNYFNFPNGLPGADLILVERGNSTYDNPYKGSIKLFDNQRLLGEGAANVAPIILTTNTFGNCQITPQPFTLPGFNGSGNQPFVSNLGGAQPPIVTLANNNEVAGFNFINAGGDAIFGNNVNNFNLHDLEITGNAGHGIALTNATGSSTVIKNINLGVTDYDPTPHGPGNNQAGGILVTAGAAGLSNLQLTGINMSSKPAGVQPYGISLMADNGSMTTTLTNVTTNGNVVGLKLEETGQNLVATLNGVTSTTNTGDGIEITGTGGTVNVTSTNPAAPVVANSNGGSGIVYTQNGGTGLLSLTSAQANSNGLDGLGLFSSNSATTTVTITNGSFNLNARDGIHDVQTTGANLNLTVDPTTLNQNGRDGFYYNLSGASVLTAVFQNDSLLSNTGSAFFGTMDGSTANLTLTNVTATDSLQNGFHIDATNGSVFTTSITNSTFSRSHANGFDIQLTGASTGTFNMTGVVDNNSTQNGMSFLADNSNMTVNASGLTINGSGANGIVGTAQNAAAVSMSVIGTSSISNNSKNGVFVTANSLATFDGSFTGTAINNNGNNGVWLSLDNSPNSSLNLTGGATVNGNTANGLRVDATTNSLFSPTIIGTSISNNGQDGVLFNVASGSAIGTSTTAGNFTNDTINNNGTNGVEVNVAGAGSGSNLVFTNTQITNTSGTGPQKIGFLFDVTGGGALTADFTAGSVLKNNGQNAVNGIVSGAGSTGLVTLDGTDASGSGSTNVLLTANQGGFLNFQGQNGTNLSNSVNGAGISVNVADINTTMIVDLNGVSVNNNKTVGYSATVTDTVAPGAGQTGAQLLSDLESSTFNNNTLQGILLNVTGPGATAYYGAGVSDATAITVDNNGHEGVLATASNLGTINFRSIGSHFDHNGTAGVFDGVNFGGDNGTIRTLFYGGSTDFNSGDGMFYGPIAPNASTNGSNFTISLGNGFSSSNNGRWGLEVDGTGANSVNLIQDPSSAPIVLSGNGLGPENLNFAGVNQVLLQLLGSFNNSSGDGVHLSFNNITTAIVSINGLGNGTIDNNAGDGIFVQMVDVSNAAVTVSGYSSISNNGGNGVHIEMTGITKTINGAIEVQGVAGDTTMANNGLNGVDIQLTKTNLVNPFASLPGVNLIVLTPTDNQPLDASAPLPIVLPPGSNGVIPSHALAIDSLNISNSGATAPAGSGYGIHVNGTDSSIVTNDGFITNNTVNSSHQGDGIAVTMHNTVAPTVPTLNGLTIGGNFVGAVDPSLTYLSPPTAAPNNGDGIRVSIINDVNPNGSTADGLQIVNNTVKGNLGDGIAFLIQNPAGSTSTANNVHIDGNTSTLNQFNGLNFNMSYVQMDGLSISNNLLGANGTDGALVGLLGTTITNMTTAGNTVQFNSSNGMAMVLNNSSIATWDSTNDAFRGNTLDGLLITNSNTSSVTGATFTNGTFNSNGGDGIQMTTTDATVSTFGTLADPITFIGGTISSNGANGLDLVTLANASTGNFLFDGTTISSNAAIGARFNNVGSGSTLNVTIQDNAGTGSLINLNGGDGVQIVGSGTNTTINASVLNSSIMDNGQAGSGNGLSMILTNFDTANKATLTVTGSTIGNTAAGGTQLDGVFLSLQQTGALPAQPPASPAVEDGIVANFTNSFLTNNAASGLEGTIVGPAAGGFNLTTGEFVTFNQMTVTGNSGNGVAFNVSNGGLVSFAAQNLTTISNNGQDGLFINATDANTLAQVLIEDSSLNNNGSLVFPGDGINATALNGAHLNIGADTTGLAPVSFSGNTGSGIDVLASGANSQADIDLHNAFLGASAANGFLGNTLNGLIFQSFDGATVELRAYDTHFDGNGAAGMSGAVNDTNGLDTNGIVNIIGGSADNNGGDGYSLLATNTAGGSGFGVATVTGQFQADDNNVGISAQNNGGFGIDFVASNPVPPGGGIVGNLLMTGGSTLLNNAAGTLNVNMNGADQAIIGLSGTFDGSTTGDGIAINLSNITGLALVSLQGPGEVKNNAGNGINVSMTNVHQGGIFIGGFDGGISNNGTANGAGGLGQDGIKITMNNVGSGAGGAGALTINGQTASFPAPNVMDVSNNSGSGVNVTINNGSIIDNTAFNALLGAKLVTVIDTAGADQLISTTHPFYPSNPNNPQTPFVTDMLLTTSAQNVSNILGITLTPTVAIENLNLDNNGNATGGNLSGDGIQFTVDTGAQLVGVPTIDNNIITNTGAASTTKTHDGIVIQLLNGADVTGFNVVNNFIGIDSTLSIAGGNNGNGVSIFAGGAGVGNTAATLTSLNISNNFIENSTGQIGVTGNGIQLNIGNAPVLNTITIDGDQILNNKGDGVQMLNPNTGVDMAINFTHDTIDGNGSIVPPSATTTYPPGGMGIDIVLNNVNAITTTVNVLSNDANANRISNSASYGLFLQATNQARYNLNVTGTGAQNVFDSNTDAGIGVVAGSFVNPNNTLDPTKFSVGNILIDNVLVENTIAGSHPSLPNYPFAGDGIGILAQQYAEIASFVVGNATTRNTLLTNNQGDGLKIKAIENSQFRETLSDGVTPVTPVGQATVLLQNIDATQNGANGIEIVHQDNALLSWDDPTVNPGAALFQLGNPVSWQYITDGGSFVHLNDIEANNNGVDGFRVDTTNAQFPMTRIDIIDTALNGTSQFNGNGQNGMHFISAADSITVVHAQDTSASSNINDGILVETFNAATFGDVLTSVPVGDPTSPTAQPSTFNGMTLSLNGTAATLGKGFEVIANNQTTDPNNVSSKSVVAISMTGTATNPRNLFDSNAGDAFRFTANRFSTNYLNLNAVDMRDTQFRHLGGDGIHFITNDQSTSTLNVTNSSIGFPTASSTQTGLSGNGIHVTTNTNSTMFMFIGDQTISNPDPFNSPDVSIYGNQGAGILVQNTDNSRFFDQVYDTASRFNGNRGYSALLARASLSVNQIDNSNFSDNNREGIAVVANSESQSGRAIIVTSLGTPFNAPPLYDANHYLNLNPLTVGSLTLTNSTVSNNGNKTPYVNSITNVNGLEIDVSTYAYVAADIRNNTFHGNTLDDVATASFQASTGSGGSLGGFNADGTINGANKINTPNSLNNSPASGLDTIFLEDTALLDMRFMHNVGDQISISAEGSNNPLMNATGAFVSDQSNAKHGLGVNGTAIFQVNAFHYDTVSSAASDNVFSGTNILPLDGGPTGTVQDNANFPGPSTNLPFIGGVRNLEAGIVNQDGFYTNPNANPPNIVNPTAFTQVRVDDITTGVFGTGADGVIAYNGATGTFTLAGAGSPGISAGDTYRVHLLDTNTFNQFGVAQNVEQAFASGFVNATNVAQNGSQPFIRIPPGQTGANPNLGPAFYKTNPLAPYFDWPSVSFPPY